MSLGYTTSLKENSARAQGNSVAISFKQGIEIANYIRGNTVARAKAKLTAAIQKAEPIPFKRFTDGVGHRKGNLLAGRYPVKACTEILKLLNSAESNALFKGLSVKDLVISTIAVKQAPGQWHFGRQSRRQMKRAHVEIIVSEVASAKRAPAKKATAAEPIKSETKSEPTAAEPKTTETKPVEKAAVKPVTSAAKPVVKPEVKSEEKPTTKATEEKPVASPKKEAAQAKKENEEAATKETTK